MTTETTSPKLKQGLEITSIEDAFRFCQLNLNNLPDISMLPEEFGKPLITTFKRNVVTKAINGGWEPDWNDQKERKYFLWFEIKADKANPSGFGFSDTFCDCWYSFSVVGSRLCFKSSELAMHMAKNFEDLLIEDVLIIK